MYWFTYGENLTSAMSDPEIDAMEKTIQSLKRQISDRKDVIRTEWLWKNLLSTSIDAEPENGDTQAIFGKQVGVSANYVGWEATKVFTFDTAKGVVQVDIKNTKVFDNGTIEFSIFGKKHYVWIPEWKNLLGILMVTGW